MITKPRRIQRKPFKKSGGRIQQKGYPLPKKRPKARISPKKGQSKGLPNWIKAIPEGSHGSGTLQKRLWRLTSDFVRIRDWSEFGEFIDTGESIIYWGHAQAGHWRSYPECNGMFKFHEMNIHAQTPMGNKVPTSSTWENYRRNLVSRYSEEFVQAIDATNKNGSWRVPITKEMVLTEIKRKITLLSMLETKPPYYKRVMKLLATQQSQTTANDIGDKSSP